jgi:hypothetical protein
MNHQQELMNVFGFNQEDLERNRKGELTEAQAEKVTREHKTVLAVLLTIGLIMTIVGQFNDALSPNIDFLLIFVGICLMLYALLYYRDMAKLQVKLIMEVPTFVYVTNITLGGKTKYMVFDDERFIVSEEQSMSIRHGTFYLAYYIEGGWGLRLLSIQPKMTGSMQP